MEPVSITAGAFTILRVSLGAVATLKSVATTPSEFLRLETELKHLEDVVKEVETVSNSERHMTESLTRNVQAAQLKVQQINEFIQTRIYKADSTPTKVRRIALIKETSRLREFAKEVEAIRSRVVDCLAISNL